jgi:DNA helicase-2/ATP-dependent DNA helicase PcrA
MYVAITRAKENLYMTRSKSRYLYGKREPSMRSRFLKELSSEVELPKEIRRSPYEYSDYDDPENYGNDAYVGGRYEVNDEYSGKRTSFGGSYGGGYGSSNYGSSSRYGDNARSNSGVTRSTWNGSSYGSSSYGSTYGSKPSTTAQKIGGFTYGGMAKASKPTPTSSKDLSGYTIGRGVVHPKFGNGVIVGSRGVGSNMIIDVAFEGLGIKQLSASLAPLTLK